MFKMPSYIKKIFIGSLASVVIASNYAKCVSLSIQECTIQPTINNSHPNEYTHGLYYYQSAVNLDWCVGTCNSFNELFSKVCVPNKTEDLIWSVFNMITGINESKTLTRYILCKCKCKFDDTKWNSNQKWNKDTCLWECKKHQIYEEYCIWNPSIFVIKMINI